MIARVGRIENGTTAVMTSYVFACFSSQLDQTWAYSGSVKLPMGLNLVVKAAIFGPRHGVGCGHEAILECLRDKHQAAGNVPPRRKTCGADVLQVFINLDEAAPARIRRLRRQRFQIRGVGHPAHRHDRQRKPSALSRRPSFAKFNSHTGWRLLERLEGCQKFSRTTMPDARKAAATAAGNVPRPRSAQCAAPASKSWIREPNALKIEATCNAPWRRKPTTIIDEGTAVNCQASLCVLVSSKPGIGKSAAHATSANNNPLCLKPQSARGFRWCAGLRKRAAPTFFMDLHT